MFWRILKKDLKRKKTMNIILLLFVILCSMFAAAAMNNIIAVTGGIEHYFDAADVPDVIVRVLFSGENDLEEKIGEIACVKEIRIERYLYVASSKYFRHNGKKLENFTNIAFLLSDREMAIKYFDENNHIIESVDKGCFCRTTEKENQNIMDFYTSRCIEMRYKTSMRYIFLMLNFY